MSRIGKRVIAKPAGVDVTIADNTITVKGPKGELTRELHPMVDVQMTEDQITVHVANPEVKSERSLWGLFNSLIFNMIEGVTKGFEKKLEVNGVGYRVAQSGNKITLNVGFSHPVEFEVPEGVTSSVEKNVITLTSIDKALVGQVAANIRKVRKPEPYKGKGIKYSDEIIRRKAGKTAAK
jgi:large subunit ribosomal protein L6